jgi:hypothetical protein
MPSDIFTFTQQRQDVDYGMPLSKRRAWHANTVAYGFTGLAHLFNERVTTVGKDTVWNAVTETVTEYNRELDALLMEAGLIEPTTEHSLRYMLPGAATLQPVDEWGVPKPVKSEGYYDVAFPIQSAATAWGTNRISEALLTVDEANRLTVDATLADTDWMRRHILAALLYSSSWTYGDDQYGDLTIKPLANSDTDKFTFRNGIAPTTDNHYLAQADDIDDTHNPFPTIFKELDEHPVNAGADVVVYTPDDLEDDITALSGFVEVPDSGAIDYGDDTDLLRVANRRDAIRGFGDYVLGRVNRCWVVVWNSLPTTHMLAVARGTQDPVLRMRQYPAAELQGFQPKEHMPNEALMKRSFFRDCGFGVENRVGAVVYYVGGASYTDPTGYTAMPLAV